MALRAAVFAGQQECCCTDKSNSYEVMICQMFNPYKANHSCSKRHFDFFFFFFFLYFPEKISLDILPSCQVLLSLKNNALDKFLVQ